MSDALIAETITITAGNGDEIEAYSARPLDETPREDELPASERFADDAPNPEQVYAGTELREMINQNGGRS